jgi:hypothetical protein
MSKYAALSALATDLGMTSDELVAHAKAKAPKPARKLSTAEAIAAADRALGNHTYAAVFGDDGSPSGTAAPTVVAADGLTYERVWPTSNAKPPADPLYDAVFGKD